MNLITSTLESIDISQSTKELRSVSLLLLKSRIAKRYKGDKRQKFTLKNIKTKTEDFLKEYPIVLSTAYSAKSCISPEMVFDYVIMDEASHTEVFRDAPVTLLREHYRCHPKIIEFCNERFYDGELVAMTAEHDEKKVLKVVRTAKGNHARGHFNQREIIQGTGR